MTKQNIIITGYKDSEDKKRTSFETNKGVMSAFNNEGETLIADLKRHVERLISVDVVISNKTNQAGNPYVNIREFYGEASNDDEEQPKTAVKTEIVTDHIEGASCPTKNKPMSYEEAMAKPKEGAWGLREYEKCPVGLTVEIFNSTYVTGQNSEFVMKDCIDLVKQARDAF